MNEDYKEQEAYKKLSKSDKMTIDIVMSNLGNGSMWKQGWKSPGAPESIRGKAYHGSNNLLLTLVSMQNGYSDNRWVTFNQMKKEGWTFKTDDEGKSIGRGKGVPVSFFELRDKKTKQPYDKSVLDGMSADEKEDYMHENVYPLRKSYVVFNGDIIDGIPEKEVSETAIDETARNERVERLLEYWNENEAKILYGGGYACYVPSKDEIHLPNRNAFYNYGEFYSTALHETCHSTGHETRLNRDMSAKFGSADYATEELRAEIASMFLCQQFGVVSDENHIQNNSAYVNSWYGIIKENPSALFTAIADADKMTKYIKAKEMTIQQTTDNEQVKEEKSEEYLRPSEAAAKTMVRRMVRTAYGTYNYYICSAHRCDKTCTPHTIREETIKNAVMQAIRTQVEYALKIESVLAYSAELPGIKKGVREVDAQIARLDEDIKRYNDLKAKLYQDLQDGIVSRDEYTEISVRFTDKIQKINGSKATLLEKREKLQTETYKSHPWVDELKKYKNIETLDRGVLIALIDKIIVYDNKTIEVRFLFQDELAEMSRLVELQSGKEGEVV